MRIQQSCEKHADSPPAKQYGTKGYWEDQSCVP